MAKDFVHQLAQSVGITINGSAPWDIKVYNDEFYSRVIKDGSLGLGESYMEEWWDCENLDVFFDKILRANLDTKLKIPLHFYFKQLFAYLINLQTKERSKEVALRHYDLGNTLFQAMLDKRMIYSCGYWKQAKNLDEAQEAKLDLICKKLQLKSGESLLDIGCGWGGLAKFAAENYGVNVVGVTISKQQCELAQSNCKGLDVQILLLDYRDINEKFDKVVSVGMFEHVGHMNYPTYMQKVHDILRDDGLFLLHTIGSNQASIVPNEWITKYIFPNGALPTIEQVAHVSEKLFVMEDMQNFGAYYDNTLLAWHQNFIGQWDQLKQYYDERFYRMWTYYLLSCAGSFRARANQLWQFVFSKKGMVGGYLAPR